MDFSYLDDWMQEQVGEAAIEETGEGYRNIWVVAETAGNSLLPVTLEALGQARELADQIGVYVYAVLLGDGLESLGGDLFSTVLTRCWPGAILPCQSMSQRFMYSACRPW